MNNKEFVTELAKLRASSTFLSLQSYANEHGEVANYNIVFHISYKNALERSISILNQIVPENELEAQAKQELITSFNSSLSKMADTSVEEIDDAYTRFFDNDGSHIKGVKLHRDTDTLHLYGLVVHKKVLASASYVKRNKKPLTIAKDKLKSLCPVSKFRQFKITPNQVQQISVENLSLLPPV